MWSAAQQFGGQRGPSSSLGLDAGGYDSSGKRKSQVLVPVPGSTPAFHSTTVEIASTPGRAGDSTPELLLRSISGLTMQQDQFAFATHQAGWWQPRLQLPQHTGLLFAELVL